MRIVSRRVGTIDVPEESLISFPDGLVGLPRRRRFVILEFGAGIPLGWLQCVDDPDFGLPVAEPGIYTQDYRIEVHQREIRELQLADLTDAAILVVTTIAQGGLMVTGNLRAPLVINTRNRLGKQIVLERADLDMRTLVDPVAFARAAREMSSAGTALDPQPQAANR